MKSLIKGVDMIPEKTQLIQQKLKEFLSLSPEEKRAIDENPQYDGLFCIIQEMSDIIEASYEYEIFINENNALPLLSIERGIYSHGTMYSSPINIKEEYPDKIFSQHINEDYGYSWAA